MFILGNRLLRALKAVFCVSRKALDGLFG